MTTNRVDLPLDLIVGNIMHQTWLTIAKLRRDGDERGDDAMHEQVARRLLHAISADAGITTVLYCLDAAGAPASLDMIREGLQAVTDRQAAPTPAAAVPPLTIKAPSPPSPPSAPPPEAAA